MKQNRNELDVDFIGSSESLTKGEEKAISNFIKGSKERKLKQEKRQKSQSVSSANYKTVKEA